MQRHTLRTKLFAWLIPLLSGACFLIAWLLFIQLSNSMSLEMRRASQFSSDQAESKILSHFRISESDAQMFASSKVVNKLIKNESISDGIMFQDKILSFFERLKISKPEYTELHIIDENNTVLFSHAENIFYNPSVDSFWLSKVDTNHEQKTFIEKTTNGQIAISYASINDKDGNSVGFVSISQDLRVFNEVAHTFSPNGNNRVVYTDENEKPLHEISSLDTSLLSSTIKSAHPYHNSEKSSWRSFKKDAFFGNIYILTNADDYFQSRSELKLKAAILTFTLTGVFIFIVWVLINNLIIKRIASISYIAKEISKGNYDVLFREVDSDEIGSLHNLIGRMARSIKENQSHIERLAYHDGLTCLHNKQHFLEQLAIHKDYNHNQRLTVWSINLLNFKQINDINGCEAGNKVIINIANRLLESIPSFCARHSIKPSSVNISRGNGGKFMISAIMPFNISLPEVLAKMLHEKISHPINVDGDQFKIYSAIGWQQGGGSGTQIYERSDMAMHDAKTKNKSIIRYSDSLLIKVKENKLMSDNIKRALESSEFTLHYQPKCETFGDNSVSEFEALIRWPTDRGMISPALFIPFAEEANLIDDIDYYVMQSVIKDVSLMESIGWEGFTVSFNVSGRRIADPEFAHQLSVAIESKGVSPKHLQIEITEHSLINDIEKSIACINKIKELGVSIALDDFGTGHSSLGYLKDLRVDTLKIDRVFVMNCEIDKPKQVLLKHIISLGHDLDLNIVGEGVETKGEFEVLKSLGCDLIQGYFFYKPMTLGTILDTFHIYENENRLVG